MPKFLAPFGLLALALAFATPARADTISDGGVKFTGFVTGTTATLEIQCDGSVAACSGWFVGDVTLKGETFALTPAPSLGATTLAGYALQDGGQNNSAVATGGGCNGTQTGMALCWDAPTVLDPMGTGLNIFTATITSGAVSGPLHVQATFYNNSAGIGTMGDKVLAVSDDLTGSPSAVPEPGSLILLGTGLLAVSGFVRRRASKA